MLWFVLLRGSGALLPYIETAVFEPKDYGASVWPSWEPTDLGLGGNWYNPAIAKVNHSSYLVAFKRNLDKGNCLTLVKDYSSDINSHLSQQLVLFDEHLRPRSEPLRIVGDKWVLEFLKHCGDMRLESGMHRTKILAHAHATVAKFEYRYAFWWFELTEDAFGPLLEVSRLNHYDVAEVPWLEFQAQNVGVLWDGAGPFRLLYWITTPRLDVRSGIPPPPGANTTLETNRLVGRSRRSLHNTGTPIFLDDGLGLAIGHSHLDAAAKAHASFDAKLGETRWGNTYLMNFVLFNASTYATIATSNPFCFPSATHPSKCDLIQFVSGFLRLRDTILLTYGINDCEAAYFELPISDILALLDL